MTPEIQTEPMTAPPRPEQVEDPRFAKVHLPQLDNRSQALRLTKYLFGPLARLSTDVDGFSVVYTERNGTTTRKDLGYGADVATAIRKALVTVMESKDLAAEFPDVIQFRPPFNVVEEKRRNLTVKLGETEEIDTVAALHDNEVLEITELVRYLPIDPAEKAARMAQVKLITGPAAIRAEDNRKRMAKLQASIDAVEAEMAKTNGETPEVDPTPVEPVEVK